MGCQKCGREVGQRNASKHLKVCVGIDGLKVCKDCKEEKPVRQFQVSNGSIRRECRKCQNKGIAARKKVRILERKRALVFLLGGKCIRCGYSRSLYALDFHHPNDDKEAGVTVLLSRTVPWLRVKAEAIKCELLCAVCHREEHFGIVT